MKFIPDSMFYDYMYDPYCILLSFKNGVSLINPERVDGSHKGKLIASLKNLSVVEESMYQYLENDNGKVYLKYLMSNRPNKGKKNPTNITVEIKDVNNSICTIGNTEYYLEMSGTSKKKTIDIRTEFGILLYRIRTTTNSFAMTDMVNHRIIGATIRYNEVIETAVLNFTDIINTYEYVDYTGESTNKKFSIKETMRNIDNINHYSPIGKSLSYLKIKRNKLKDYQASSYALSVEDYVYNILVNETNNSIFDITIIGNGFMKRLDLDKTTR